MKWDGQGKKNGELLRLMVNHKFDVLLTTDRNIKYQQNVKYLPVTILHLLQKITGIKPYSH